MKYKYPIPYPYPVFELFCEFAAWDYIAQDDCVRWSPLRRKITRWLCGIGMSFTGLFWDWR